jgi:hypothetical protein
MTGLQDALLMASAENCSRALPHNSLKIGTSPYRDMGSFCFVFIN